MNKNSHWIKAVAGVFVWWGLSTKDPPIIHNKSILSPHKNFAYYFILALTLKRPSKFKKMLKKFIEHFSNFSQGCSGVGTCEKGFSTVFHTKLTKRSLFLLNAFSHLIFSTTSVTSVEVGHAFSVVDVFITNIRSMIERQIC